MSQAIRHQMLDLQFLREQCYDIKVCRSHKEWAAADAIRDEILALDSGFRISIDRNGVVTLWHWPDPPFSNQFHSANYGEFIANSEGL